MSNIAMANNKISQDNPSAWRNPWVIGWIALVLIVLIVNGVMISLAFITNPGLVTEDYYEKGQDYEQNINKMIAARKELGWTFQTDFPTDPVMNQAAHYSVNVVDKYGVALSEAKVFLHAYRPSDADADFSVEMIETINGRYEAKIKYPLKGFWEYTIDVKRDEDVYKFTRRASVLAQ